MKYDAVYPKITWRDGIPKNAKEEAEVFQIRTGGKATIDVVSAVKRMDSLNDQQAHEIEDRIAEDERKAFGTVDSTIFNE